MDNNNAPEQPSPVEAFHRSTGPLIGVSVVDDTDPWPPEVQIARLTGFDYDDATDLSCLTWDTVSIPADKIPALIGWLRAAKRKVDAMVAERSKAG